MDDVDAVLKEAAVALTQLPMLYEEALRVRSESSALRTLVKRIVDNQRPALEYVAHETTVRFGTLRPGGHTYYPLAPEAVDFERSIDRRMPGVRRARPDIAVAIERHQPYQPGHEWLRSLEILSNENKHISLTPQTRDETRRVSIQSPEGSVIEYQTYQEGKGGVVFNGEVTIGRNSVVKQIVYVDWLFTELLRSALQTLREMQAGVEGTVHDILGVAGL